MPDTPATAAVRRIDAVVVPAARPAGSLVPAIRTARSRGCPLVVLASHRCEPGEVVTVARDQALPDDQLLVIDFGPAAAPLLPEFTADSYFRDVWVPQAQSSAATGCSWSAAPRNTSLKRNAALALGWLQRWSTVLFLDDDVTPPSGEQLDHAVAMFDADQVAIAKGLARAPVAIGFRHVAFPDNSIVRHAGRLADLDPDVQIGAGAFLIRLDLGAPPHFPYTYNEDWLFFWDCWSAGRGGVVDGGQLGQQEYDPFADPQAARWQEYGDLVAEGMRFLGYAGQESSELFSSDEWCIVVSRRRELIAEYMSRLEAAPGSAEVRKALACLQVAAETLAENAHWATQIPRYLTAWRHDARVWQEHLGELEKASEPGADPDAVLALLRLERHRPVPVRPELLEAVLV